MRPWILSIVCLTFGLFSIPQDACGDDPPSAVGSVLKLLQSGRVPESRLAAIVEIVGTRGNEHDLAYLFSQAALEDRWPTELRLKTLTLLLDAARTRKVIPAGDLSGIVGLITSPHRELQLPAMRLAGAWKVQAAAQPLQKQALESQRETNLRESALQALRQIDPQLALTTIGHLLDSNQSFAAKSAAVAVMTTLDLKRAAAAAAQLLASAGERDDPVRIIDAFLAIEGGAQVLAEALAAAALRTDVAKLALRHMYSVGRSDAELSEVLGKSAGFDANPPPPTQEEIARLILETAEKGDPERGEWVFRRSDLSCMKCHAVSQAGGQIGPDLSAIGSSSPLDYIVTSILDPDQAIKEAYVTKVVVTLDGHIHQGLVVDRTDERLVLKDANGNLVTLAVADIEEEIEGKSLMPKGLVKFMTHAELLDLASFLSQLGRPGPYAVRQTPRMQRWRLLLEMPPEILDDVPNETTFENSVLLSPNWISVYAMADGRVPLAELAERVAHRILYLQGEVEVSQGGPVGVTLDAIDGVNIWVDDRSLPAEKDFSVHLEPGRHAITLRVDRAQRPQPFVKLELYRLPGTETEFRVVDGQ